MVAGTASAVVFAPGPVGDYYDPGTLTLNFAAAGSQTLPIGLFDDMDEEGDQVFTAVLSNPTGGGVIGSPSTATVKIVDNELIGTAVGRAPTRRGKKSISRNYKERRRCCGVF